MKKFENIENVIAKERSDCGNLKEQVVYAIIKNQCHSEAQPKNPSAAYDLLDSSHSFRMTMFPSLVARRFPRLRLGMTVQKRGRFPRLRLGMTCPTLSQRLSSLLKMTFPVVAFTFVLSFAQIGEARATPTCDCGTAGHETECCWEITEVTKDGKTEKVLTISPGVDENGAPYENVVMKDYTSIKDVAVNGYAHYKSSAPWARQDVNSVKVDAGIKNIGNDAFAGEGKIIDISIPYVETIGVGAFEMMYAITSVDMPNVTKIGGNAFAHSSALQNVSMPKVEGIPNWAFAHTALESVDMPNVTRIGANAFTNSYNHHSLKYIGFSTQKDAEGCLINDKGERLTNKKNNCITEVDISETAFTGNDNVRSCASDGSGCGSCGYTKETGHQYVKRGLGCVKHCGDGLVGKGNKCVEGGCGDGYVQVEDWCNRVRYTPAEAAAILKDNENTVTITFRK